MNECIKQFTDFCVMDRFLFILENFAVLVLGILIGWISYNMLKKKLLEGEKT